MSEMGSLGTRLRFRDIHGKWRRGGANIKIFDEIGPRLTLGWKVSEGAILESLDLMVDDIEQWMQENAPWEDRTGMAREGLKAEVAREHNSDLLVDQVTRAYEFAIVVYHTVSYGLYLEVRWNGRYAIINPTVEHWGEAVMHGLKVF